MKASTAGNLSVAILLTAHAFADPPKLVSTSPELWAVGINASSQKTISLTFDQPMRSGFSDWFGRDVLSPPSDLHTLIPPDRMTCNLEVHLTPGKVYICGLNERGIPGVGFQNDKGRSLPPTYLVFQTAGTPTPQDAPPHVLQSNPQYGATGIDARRVRSLSITFDRPMNPKKNGLQLFENNNPVDISKAPFSYSPDGLTFTLPYNFKPSTQYRFELNNIHDIGFSGANRVPLWPVQISFATAQ
jgi:Bacterial Ig-like domain